VKVIGANTGGIPEVINSKVGALFQSENHVDLADKLRNFENKYSREKIRNHFENVFSYEKIGQQIAELYYD
jgi:glycosyltransferase involved in cell wall biosynthesis